MDDGNGVREAHTAGAEALWQLRNHENAEAFAVVGPGAASVATTWPGATGSAGVSEQGKGAGGAAREPANEPQPSYRPVHNRAYGSLFLKSDFHYLCPRVKQITLRQRQRIDEN
jgi:hypothetical protein